MSQYGYDYYDLLRESFASSSNFTVIPLVDKDQHETEISGYHVGRNLHWLPETDEILCHIPIIFRWSQDQDDISSEAYGGSAAALLAINHFNTGNSSIVNELENIQERCPIRFTTELIDSRSSGSVAMQSLTRLLTRRSDDFESPQPCSLIGSSLSSTTRLLATVTGVYDLPHVTSSASSVELDDEIEYPLFARTHPSDASMAQLSINYLSTQLGVEYAAVLYVDNTFGNSYNSELLKQASLYNMTIVSEGFRSGATDEEVSAALERLKKSGYRYVLGVFFSGDYERIMTRAMELEIAGPDTFWMFNGALASMFINGHLSVEKDSPLAQATFGTAILSDEGGLPGLDLYHDRFLTQWRGIGGNKELLDYINAKQPKSSTLSFDRTSSYFEWLAPSHISAFSYDAVVGLGLSACKTYEENKQLNPDAGIFSGQQHHAEFVKTRFNGASGDVIIGPDSFSRKANSTYHVVSNILPRSGLPSTSATNENFQGQPWIVFDTSTLSWQRYDEINEFIYSGGSAVPPQQIPAAQMDYLEVSPAVRGVCLTLGGLAMFLSICFYAYCCVVQRNHRVIRAAQPLFLGLICLGSLILASSIIPASFDDTVVSARGADVACVAKFWLFPMGFCLIFSALFSKLWRINKLLSNAITFQRIQVTAFDVMIPLIVLMGSNVLVLTLWTILDPPYLEREVLETDQYGRPSETRGFCYSDNQEYFLYPLVAINGVALILALWQAWIGRGITTEFSESKFVAMATVCIFQAIFMGVPIMIIADDDSTAYLFVYTTIVSVICFSILLLIFVPKIMAIRSNDPASAPSVSITNSSMRVGGKKVKLGGSSSFNNTDTGNNNIGRVSMSGEVQSSQGFVIPEMSRGQSNSSDNNSRGRESKESSSQGRLSSVVEESGELSTTKDTGALQVASQ